VFENAGPDAEAGDGAAVAWLTTTPAAPTAAAMATARPILVRISLMPLLGLIRNLYRRPQREPPAISISAVS
jgi:hypothetical protein